EASRSFKGVSLSAPIVGVGRSNCVVVELLRIHAGVAEMLIDHHQTVWIAERKRPEQNRPHHREQRCRGADAQRHHEDGNDGKSRRAEESAGADPKVAKKILPPSPTPDSAGLLGNQSGIAESTQGGVARFFW